MLKFPTTQWAELFGENALSFLAEHYWHPIYYYFKMYAKFENPEDLTQKFFLKCQEKDFLGHVAKGSIRGAFRKYLQKALRNFFLNELEHRNALKRGGHIHQVALEDEIIDEKNFNEGFTRVWAKEFWKHCYQEMEKKSLHYEIFVKKMKSGLTTRDLANEFSISEKKIYKILHKERQTFSNVVKTHLKKICPEKYLQQELDILIQCFYEE